MSLLLIGYLSFHSSSIIAPSVANVCHRQNTQNAHTSNETELYATKDVLGVRVVLIHFATPKGPAESVAKEPSPLRAIAILSEIAATLNRR